MHSLEHLILAQRVTQYQDLGLQAQFPNEGTIIIQVGMEEIQADHTEIYMILQDISGGRRGIRRINDHLKILLSLQQEAQSFPVEVTPIINNEVDHSFHARILFAEAYKQSDMTGTTSYANFFYCENI
jgi:hypothetical protein